VADPRRTADHAGDVGHAAVAAVLAAVGSDSRRR
jgi:hypothetical protein